MQTIPLAARSPADVLAAARRVVTRPQDHPAPQTRLLAWHALVSARGGTLRQSRLRAAQRAAGTQ